MALTLLPHLSLLTATQAITGAIIGYLSLWTIATVFFHISKKTGMGHGDFKLLAALGAWNGWQTLAITVFISSILALLYCGFCYIGLWINNAYLINHTHRKKLKKLH
ncbi:MAG: prepilin peptidase [Gammaproteobacteria bacterium]|nr:prepilin peptidase [Gammaproteobacteria bacterium]